MNRVLKAGIGLAFALPVALVSSNATAATPSANTGTAKTQVVQPDVGSCKFAAAGPQQPVYHGPAYGTGWINSCVGDVETCHLIVDLEKIEPQGYYVTVASKDGGWVSCSGKVLKPAYGCPGGYSSTSFRTLSLLTVEGSGGPGAPGSVYSAVEKLNCA